MFITETTDLVVNLDALCVTTKMIKYPVVVTIQNMLLFNFTPLVSDSNEWDVYFSSVFSGYVAIVVGAIVTVLVQSSSVVSSVLTPLAGVGMVTLERVFPLMLGANIGTTSTAILAAFAATGDRIVPSFQIAMCHLFFNLTGILLWYPLPPMRKIPLKLATYFGKTTATYRWFAFTYLFLMFFIFPMSVFLLSLPGWWLLASVGIPLVLAALTIGTINLLQRKKPQWLPKKLRTWEFLPLCLRSLEPVDRVVNKALKRCNCCGCCDNVIHNDDYNNNNRGNFDAIKDSEIELEKNHQLKMIMKDSDTVAVCGLSYEDTENLNETPKKTGTIRL